MVLLALAAAYREWPLGHPEGVLAARLAAQALTEPLATPGAVVERLLAVQAQDWRGMRLAVRARTTGLTTEDLDAALDAGDLVVGWFNRTTLHLVRREDAGWLHLLTAPRGRTANARRLAQEGVTDPDRAVAGLLRALADEGPLVRGQIGERLGLRGQALAHVLLAAALNGDVLRGPVHGNEQAYVLWEDWLGPREAVDRDTALAELGRRYLAGHGPADAADLARWAGVTLTDARRALPAEPVAAAEPAGDLPVRLLGPFDPLLLGWASRDFLGASEHALRMTLNGIIRAVALVGGRPVANWRVERRRLVLEPFGDLDAAARAALEADGDDVLRFLKLAPR